MRRLLLQDWLRKLAGKAGRYLSHAAEHGLPANSSIGRHSYGLTRQSIENERQGLALTIGNFCSIAPGVRFLLGVDHPTDLPSTFPFRSRLFGSGINQDAVSKGDIVLGHDVWIGRNAIILSGVTVGTGAIVGAGAVVAKDVAPYAIVVGNPAREVRKRFTDDVIENLLHSAWWDLPDDLLKSIDRTLYDRDIGAFLREVSRLKGPA